MKITKYSVICDRCKSTIAVSDHNDLVYNETTGQKIHYGVVPDLDLCESCSTRYMSMWNAFMRPDAQSPETFEVDESKLYKLNDVEL